jgi:hypothetical protein
MKEEEFQELLTSIREGGAILRGEMQASRVFKVEVPHAPRSDQPQFAICVQTDDPELLIPHKLYQVTVFPSGDIGVQDEAGEAAIYPADHFILIELPSEVEHALLEA